MKALVIAAATIAAAFTTVGQAAPLTTTSTIEALYDSSTYNVHPDHTFEGGIDNGGYAGNTTRGDRSRNYLQFSLGALGVSQQITSAVLSLDYCCDYMGVGALGIYATSDDWHGTTIAWNNQPNLGDLLTTFAPVEGGIYTIDLTEYVVDQYDNDGIVSLVIAGIDSDSWRYFNAGSQTLTVVTAVADVPEPAMLSLFGLGLIGLASRRRRSALAAVTIAHASRT